MIVREFYKQRKDGIKLYRTYSDENKYILQNETNALYGEAVDVEDSGYTYTETEKIIEDEENER